MNEWTHKNGIEIKEHIREIAEIQKNKARELYTEKKNEFVKQNLENKKKEITKALEPYIKQLEKAINELQGKVKETEYDIGYCLEGKIPKIEEGVIERQLENEFERKKEIDNLLNLIEQKRLQAIEKVLFSDAKEQEQIIKELREMKIEI
jgi:hypothetical protein